MKASHTFRVVDHRGDVTPYYTLRGAATHAAIRRERGESVTVEYRTRPGEPWLTITATLELDPARIPTDRRPLTEAERIILGLGPVRPPVPDG